MAPLDDTVTEEGVEVAARGAKVSLQKPAASAVVDCFSPPHVPSTAPEPPHPHTATGAPRCST